MIHALAEAGVPGGPEGTGSALIALIYAGFGLVGVLATLVVPRLHAQKKELRAVREQVQNSHKTNLRDDIDRVIGLAESLVEGQARHEGLLQLHGTALTNLRTDLAWERRERMDLSHRVDALN